MAPAPALYSRRARPAGSWDTDREEPIAALDRRGPDFDLHALALAARRAQAETRIAERREAVERLQEDRRAFGAAVLPLLRERSRIEVDCDAARGKIEQARQLDGKLDRAPNGYERKKIHGRCERELGHGSPARVIRERERLIEGHERTLGKLDDRLRGIARRWERDIRTLVIDGSNLCYAGETFIGLHAIEALLPDLIGRYGVTVVFDASIRRKLSMGDAAIPAALAGEAEIIVTLTKTAADETILKLAGDDETVFVPSNDRFLDFPEMAAVASSRLIRHSVTADRVMVEDLGLDLPLVPRV